MNSKLFVIKAEGMLVVEEMEVILSACRMIPSDVEVFRNVSEKKMNNGTQMIHAIAYLYFVHSFFKFVISFFEQRNHISEMILQ